MEWEIKYNNKIFLMIFSICQFYLGFFKIFSSIEVLNDIKIIKVKSG